MAFEPSRAVGLVVPVPATPRVYSGSCFRFQWERVVVTARHCIPENTEFVLAFPQGPRVQRVEEVKFHPRADIAVVLTEPQPGDSRDQVERAAFWGSVGNWSLGEEFMVYGYPSESPLATEDSSRPLYSDDMAAARLVRGHYQRFRKVITPAGYQYLAGEMNVAVPLGMSGSPIFRPGALQMVTGIVTTSVESHVVTDSVEEVSVDGRTHRTEARQVVRYGLALMLSDVGDWLQDVVPPGERS